MLKSTWQKIFFCYKIFLFKREKIPHTRFCKSYLMF